MRLLILCVLLSLYGCTTTAYGTVENCTVTELRFMGYALDTDIDCTDNANDESRSSRTHRKTINRVTTK